MPIHPYDPSIDDEEGEKPPDIGELIRRILGDRKDRASGARSPK